MKKILVTTDGSEGGNRAIDFAVDIAGTYGAELLIANVISDDSFPDKVFESFSSGQKSWFHDLLASASAEILTKARERARSGGATSVRLESRSGDIAQTILDVAQENGMDAIVAGKRGAGRVAGFLLGSVSQKLVSLAPLPVIIVP